MMVDSGQYWPVMANDDLSWFNDYRRQLKTVDNSSLLLSQQRIAHFSPKNFFFQPSNLDLTSLVVVSFPYYSTDLCYLAGHYSTSQPKQITTHYSSLNRYSIAQQGKTLVSKWKCPLIHTSWCSYADIPRSARRIPAPTRTCIVGLVGWFTSWFLVPTCSNHSCASPRFRFLGPWASHRLWPELWPGIRARNPRSARLFQRMWWKPGEAKCLAAVLASGGFSKCGTRWTPGWWTSVITRVTM